MSSEMCWRCGRRGNLEYRHALWYETVRKGGGPASYQLEHETEGWFCKGILIPGEDELDPASYESCWEKHLEDIDNGRF